MVNKNPIHKNGVSKSFLMFVLHRNLVRKHQDGAEVQHNSHCSNDGSFFSW